MNRRINYKDIEAMPSRYRATFFNSISGFRSTYLVGTSSAEFGDNLAIFNSIVHLGSNPPLLGLVMRPATVERHTLDNIISSKVYSLNQVTTSTYQAAHQTSAKYPRGVSEFNKVGLSVWRVDGFEAPFVEESKIKFAMELEEIMPIKVNDTLLVVGRISEVILDDVPVGPDGFVDICAADTATSSGLDAYYQTQLLERMPYAKP